MDAAYVKAAVGPALAEACARVSRLQPEDPVEWLSAFLRHAAAQSEQEALRTAQAAARARLLQAAAAEEERLRRRREEAERLEAARRPNAHQLQCQAYLEQLVQREEDMRSRTPEEAAFGVAALTAVSNDLARLQLSEEVRRCAGGGSDKQERELVVACVCVCVCVCVCACVCCRAGDVPSAACSSLRSLAVRPAAGCRLPCACPSLSRQRCCPKHPSPHPDLRSRVQAHTFRSLPLSSPSLSRRASQKQSRPRPSRRLSAAALFCAAMPPPSCASGRQSMPLSARVSQRTLRLCGRRGAPKCKPAARQGQARAPLARTNHGPPVSDSLPLSPSLSFYPPTHQNTRCGATRPTSCWIA